MREILFRAKRVDNGKWTEGYYVCNRFSIGFAKEPIIYENHYIYTKRIDGEKRFKTIAVNVIPETVGQFTGLTDKNRKKIFEGDIIKENDIYHKGELQIKGNTWRVAFADGLFFGNFKDISVYLQSLDGMEVIGNIHDNPELLEDQDDERN